MDLTVTANDILLTASYLLLTGSNILSTGSNILLTGSYILLTGSNILFTGSYILLTGSNILFTGSNILFRTTKIYHKSVIYDAYCVSCLIPTLHCREMSRHRITVEWGIGRCKNLFQMMNNKVLNILTSNQSRISNKFFSEQFEKPDEPGSYLLVQQYLVH